MATGGDDLSAGMEGLDISRDFRTFKKKVKQSFDEALQEERLRESNCEKFLREVEKCIRGAIASVQGRKRKENIQKFRADVAGKFLHITTRINNRERVAPVYGRFCKAIKQSFAVAVELGEATRRSDCWAKFLCDLKRPFFVHFDDEKQRQQNSASDCYLVFTAEYGGIKIKDKGVKIKGFTRNIPSEEHAEIVLARFLRHLRGNENLGSLKKLKVFCTFGPCVRNWRALGPRDGNCVLQLVDLAKKISSLSSLEVNFFREYNQSAVPVIRGRFERFIPLTKIREGRLTVRCVKVDRWSERTVLAVTGLTQVEKIELEGNEDHEFYVYCSKDLTIRKCIATFGRYQTIRQLEKQ